ncbi:Gfo/Idh/MocA family protein [Paenibacillus koleovorans]|uniref:Gfo/Idh/MocA family protein n=1 Tax=Paenibacillus koleovorans TaxID=121608 RepID=UPI000FD7736D|nr:Gfo/Idh/MocA family oxidoreductase [Paenibacillus koleovorans]
MKVCLIGSTGHTGYVLKGLRGQTDADLIGIAPGSQGEETESLLKLAGDYGYTPIQYQHYTQMLDDLQPDIAAVACHFNDHAAVAIEALNRGIHVFVEKPIATTLEDLDLVRAAYDKSNVHLAAMLGIRYEDWFLTVQNLLEERSIGEIRLMNAQKSYKLGKRSALYTKRETYGGTIPWVGSHAIDWMHALSGEKFYSVYAAHSTKANNGHGDLESTALCHFTFSHEVFGSATIDYLRPRQASSHDDDRIRIVGTTGVLEAQAGKVLLINDAQPGIREMPLLPKREIFTDFLQQVRGEGPCKVTAEQSFLVTEACLKARISADEGRIVYFEA